MTQKSKHLVFIILAAIIFCCFAAACFGCGRVIDENESHGEQHSSLSDNTPGTARKMYQYKQDNSSSGFSLLLTDTNSFTLIFPLVSSYCGYGGYTEENGLLTLTTSDSKKYVYVFHVQNDGSLIFDESLSKMNTSFPMQDKTVFK